MALRAASKIEVSPTQDSGLMLIRDLVHERTGIHFDNQALPLMADKLVDRLSRPPRPSYLDYYYLLKQEAEDSAEWREVINLFSVQETYFWREVDQIRNLVDRIVPEWFARTTAPLTIWSAACASGEEPYSIAMALDLAGWGHHPIRIHASDASENALLKASSALYRERSFRLLPSAIKGRYFEEHPKGWKLCRDIVERVSFQWINLVAEAEFDRVPQPHVIFCRNVFIYFSPTSISKVVRAFGHRLPTGGFLFVGATESLLKLTDQFELCDMGNCFVYRKNLKAS